MLKWFVFVPTLCLVSHASAEWMQVNESCIATMAPSGAGLIACVPKENMVMFIFADKSKCVPNKINIKNKTEPLQCKKLPEGGCVVEKKFAQMLANDPDQPVSFYCGKKEFVFNLNLI